jgi:hypothetical protein
MRYRIAMAAFVYTCAHASFALAASDGDLAGYLGDQIASAQNAITSCSVSSSGDAFELKKIQIEISPTVKFKLDTLVELSVSPEIDFTFEN